MLLFFTNITNSVILTGNFVYHSYLSGLCLQILLRLQKHRAFYLQNLFCCGKKLALLGAYTEEL